MGAPLFLSTIMARLHLITGHRCISRSDEPILIYCGHDADAALAARDAAVQSGKVLLADRFLPDSPVTLYSDKPLMKISEEGGVGLVFIPVEIGPDGEKITINVATEKDAEILKSLAEGAIAACNEIKRLQGSMSESLTAHQASMAAAESELAACRESFANHETFVAAANAEKQRLQEEKAAADAEIARLQAELVKRDETIAQRDKSNADLELRLAAVTSAGATAAKTSKK